MDPLTLIDRHYPPGSLAREVLLVHSELVAQKALQLAGRAGGKQPDTSFIYQAAMLHDIGIFLTHAPEIGCSGEAPYICHGYLGRELVEAAGYPRHALVCERHTGTGISLQDIRQQNLPLPARDMRPQSLEEQIVCFADKFFSKNPLKLRQEKSLEKVRRSQAKYGAEKLRQIDEWITFFDLG